MSLNYLFPKMSPDSLHNESQERKRVSKTTSFVFTNAKCVAADLL